LADVAILVESGGVSDIVLLVPVDGDPEIEDWLAEYDLDSGDRRGRPPTVAEVREAVGELGPVSVEEHFGGTRWQVDVLFGPITHAPSGALIYTGGFELSAKIANRDDGAPATDLSARGGDFDVVMKLARSLAAVTGPLVAMSASEGEPVLID
jgi:hypothetical protein